MKKVLLLMVLTSSFFIVHAQNRIKEQKHKERTAHLDNMRKDEDEDALIYNKQNAFGIKLNTDGYGLFFEHGKYKTLQLTNLWWIGLDERKDPKEQKVSNTDGFLQIGNPFVYGKINSFYSLKVGIGQQRLIGGKDVKNGVAVSAIYGGGLSAGLIKPYYISTTDSATGKTTDVKYSPQTDNVFRYGPINGGSGFGKGFNQLSVVPGAHARLALRFDYGHYNELLSAIEAGVTAQYYTKDVQLMLSQPGRKFFFNAYVAIDFGKRK